jgi:heme o synthase
VLLYTVWLKRRTVQNVVIGGIAGALLPLVGWAAATGTLDLRAPFLGFIILLWTPPHFWALALLHGDDYARAGLPMLPVVRGDAYARGRILATCVALVVATLLGPLCWLAGTLFLAEAAALGAMLLFSAWRLWRKGGEGPARALYRFSSLYLGLLLLALVVDRLLNAPLLP